jgi:hypothetical protein
MRVCLCINLEHKGFPGHIDRRLCDLWCRRPAGSTPARPEIDEYRHSSVRDDLVKQPGIDGERLRQWREGRLTNSATTGATQILSSYTVLLFAFCTRTDDWHGKPRCERT